jgi:hypothetical protein
VACGLGLLALGSGPAQSLSGRVSVAGRRLSGPSLTPSPAQLARLGERAGAQDPGGMDAGEGGEALEAAA